MRTLKMWSLLALLGFALLDPPQTSAAPIMAYNEDARLRVAAAANDFEIVVPGNRSFSNFRFGFSGPGNGETVTFNSLSNTTTLNFFGRTITPSTITPPDTLPGELHFGYTVSADSMNRHGLGPPDTLAKDWTLNGNVVEAATPGFTIALRNLRGNAPGEHYLLVNLAALVVGGTAAQRVIDFALIPIGTATAANVVLGNESQVAMQVFSAGSTVMLDTAIDPKGDSDPNFGAMVLAITDPQHFPLGSLPSLGIPDGTTVQPGQEISSIPEPRSLIPFSLGILCLFGFVSHKHVFGMISRRWATA